MREAPSGKLAANIMHFARVLRGAGLSVPIGCVLGFAEALDVVGLHDRDPVYWAGLTTLVRRPEGAPERWPDLRELWRLLRLQPVRLLCIALLAAAAVGGLWSLGTQAQAWLGVGRLAPHTMIPWRANIHWALFAELPNFPLHFLHFAIEGCILAEAYRRLLAAHQPVHSRRR